MFVPAYGYAYGELERMNWRLRHCKLLESREKIEATIYGNTFTNLVGEK